MYVVVYVCFYLLTTMEIENLITDGKLEKKIAVADVTRRYRWLGSDVEGETNFMCYAVDVAFDAVCGFDGIHMEVPGLGTKEPVTTSRISVEYVLFHRYDYCLLRAGVVMDELPPCPRRGSFRCEYTMGLLVLGGILVGTWCALILAALVLWRRPESPLRHTTFCMIIGGAAGFILEIYLFSFYTCSSSPETRYWVFGNVVRGASLRPF